MATTEPPTRDELIRLIAEGTGCGGHYSCSRPPMPDELDDAAELLDDFLASLPRAEKAARAADLENP
ncbi:hypothetical protein [Streptomyces sp. NRRL B-24484]|uniref:hypothetical protein n=1 Tax=Streptomyces sp. NRRL B-24484 TaxID=1463833 RepID=UPI0004BF76FC|nr:hypothetical protein [Streptomyces sp. NRRL B-24484]